jgi:hypothetical protein
MQQFLGRYISRMDIVCFNLQTQNAEKIMCAFFSEKKKKNRQRFFCANMYDVRKTTIHILAYREKKKLGFYIF